MKGLTISIILGLLALLTGCQSESTPPPQQSFDPAPWLEKGNAFMAVGALHLPGDKGLVALLREKGFTLEPVVVASN